uniref:uncharacterized protein LOC131136762 n=1 Tax=Doryrhamphus excisus TaxID=161450 RepID=UPI0025AE398B|nr:uncharacterized protein LOC131136762 [Doryrhamphus excisus]
MPYKKEKTFLPNEEDTHADKKSDTQQQMTLSQHMDVGELSEDTQSQVGKDDAQIPPETKKIRRTRKLTEKGRSLLDDKVTNLNTKFVKLYTRWKYHINGLKRSIKSNDAEDLIDEIINEINTFQVDIDNTYLEIRSISNPESDIRRMNDTCQALTKIANVKAQHFHNGYDSRDIPWPDDKSVFGSTVASSVFSAQTAKSVTSSKSSQHSSILFLNAKQAAAEALATQRVIKIVNVQNQQREEIQRLEVEEKVLKADREAKEREFEAESAKKRAQFIAESAERKMRMEKKRREVERLEELKGHVAAQARLQVYSESLHPSVALNPLSEPFFPSHQIQVSHPPVEPAKASQVHQQHEVKVPLQYPSVRTSYSVAQPTKEVPATKAVNLSTSDEASIDLVKTLAEAIIANRVPIPEPDIFKGDPLKYNDWKLSFCALIDRKNLPTQEKLFFLRKYVGGTAKRAIEGHFLAGTETTYHAAWGILEDRFGNPFIVAKAYLWNQLCHMFKAYKHSTTV